VRPAACAACGVRRAACRLCGLSPVRPVACAALLSRRSLRSRAAYAFSVPPSCGAAIGEVKNLLWGSLASLFGLAPEHGHQHDAVPPGIGVGGPSVSAVLSLLRTCRGRFARPRMPAGPALAQARLPAASRAQSSAGRAHSDPKGESASTGWDESRSPVGWLVGSWSRLWLWVATDSEADHHFVVSLDYGDAAGFATVDLALVFGASAAARGIGALSSSTTSPGRPHRRRLRAHRHRRPSGRVTLIAAEPVGSGERVDLLATTAGCVCVAWLGRRAASRLLRPRRPPIPPLSWGRCSRWEEACGMKRPPAWDATSPARPATRPSRSSARTPR